MIYLFQSLQKGLQTQKINLRISACRRSRKQTRSFYNVGVSCRVITVGGEKYIKVMLEDNMIQTPCLNDPYISAGIVDKTRNIHNKTHTYNIKYVWNIRILKMFPQQMLIYRLGRAK